MYNSTISDGIYFLYFSCILRYNIYVVTLTQHFPHFTSEVFLLATTIKDIAQKAGVSIGTVDRALHNRGRIKTEVQQKILSIAAELNYKPNILGQQLNARQTPFHLGFILPRSSGFWSELEHGIHNAEEQMAPFGVKVSIRYFEHQNEADFLQGLSELIALDVQGLAVVLQNMPTAARKLSAYNLPIVLVNNPVEEMEQFHPLCYLGSDYYQAGRIAAGIADMILRDSEKKEIVIFRSSSLWRNQDLRIRGFLSELEKTGLPYHVCDTVNLESGNSREIVSRYIAAHPNVNLAYTVGGSARAVGEGIAMARDDHFVRHIGFDVHEQNLTALKNGHVDVLIDQEVAKQGSRPIKILYNYLLTGEKPESPMIYVKNEIFLSQSFPEK